MNPTALKILGALSVGLSASVAAATAGVVPAILAGIGAASAFIAGLNHPTPVSK